MSSEISQEHVETNPYLAQRAAKIAQNEARLRSLGLINSKGARGKEQIQTKPSVGKQKTNIVAATEPVRRSKRLRKEDISYREDSIRLTKSKNFPRESTLDDNYAPDNNNENTTAVPSASKQAPRATPPPNSARAINLSVNRLLMGHNGVAGLLGKQLSNTGKAFVMQESARHAALSGGHNPANISFNKYSGVQEWRNDVLFLWVNLDAPQSEVTNEFPQKGRQITWFGGSRMHNQTPVIQRLVRVGKNIRASDEEDIPGIVLWCRRYDSTKKTFSPYTCLGRLSYSSHDANSRPLSFVWNLEDYSALSEHPDSDIRRHFHSLVS